MVFIHLDSEVTNDNGFATDTFKDIKLEEIKIMQRGTMKISRQRKG